MPTSDRPTCSTSTGGRPWRSARRRSPRRATAGPSSATSRSATITRPFQLAVELGGIEEFPGSPRHAGFEATGELRRKDFGIDLALPPGVNAVALGDVVKIELDVQLLEPATS